MPRRKERITRWNELGQLQPLGCRMQIKGLCHVGKCIYNTADWLTDFQKLHIARKHATLYPSASHLQQNRRSLKRGCRVWIRSLVLTGRHVSEQLKCQLKEEWNTSAQLLTRPTRCKETSVLPVAWPKIWTGRIYFFKSIFIFSFMC